MTEETKFPTAQKKRRTSLQRQRLAVIITLCVVVVLAVAFGIIHYFTSRVVFRDVDGTKYFIREKRVEVTDAYGKTFKDKRWVMLDGDGNRLPQNENANYETPLGTIVSVDYETGKYTVVAAYIISNGEAAAYDYELATYDVLLYPKLTTGTITSIEVQNKNGSYTFVATEKGTLEIKGHEGLPYIDSVMIDTLVELTGNAKALKRINVTEAYNEKSKEYKSLEGFRNNGYAEYGLSEDPAHADIDESYFEGYFIIKGTDAKGNAVEHKVIIGNQILSGAGYYVRYAGRDEVYVLRQLEELESQQSTFSATLLGTLEDYVTPMIITPMDSNRYFDVSDFTLSKYNESMGEFVKVVQFSYIPIQIRDGGFDTHLPYHATKDSPLSGYRINSFNADDCLQSIQSIAPFRTVKLYSEYPGEGDDPDMNVKRFIAEYCGGQAAFAIGFTYHDARDEKTYEPIADKSYPNQIWISPKNQETNSYYLFNATYNMVVECSVAYLGFLDWEQLQWVESYIFSGNNIAFLKKLEIKLAGKSDMTFYLDNSQSPTQEDALNSDNLRVTADYNGLQNVTVNTDQFRLFYRSLGNSSLWKTMPEGTEALQESLRAAGDSGATLVIRMTYDNEGTDDVRVFRFYSKTAGNLGAFTTLNNNGSFYMRQFRLDKIIRDIDLIFTPETPIDPDAQ